ncbi:MAG: DNA gyrase C-terminal beta-propeller domain-containing protein [Chloroflexota bacterium]
MSLERPDLSGVPQEVLDYIEALETQVASKRRKSSRARKEENEVIDVPMELSEPPTTVQLITITASGVAKRTARHHYTRQRRGGMGVFDIEADPDDPPKFLIPAEIDAGLVLVTSHARAFHLSVESIIETDVRGKGESILAQFPLREDETLSLIFPDKAFDYQGGSHLALVSKRGQVRRIGAQYLSRNLKPGTVLYDVKNGGAPAAACWTTGGIDDIFIATRKGKGIRFAEKQVPMRGCLGMRVDPSDEVVGIACVPDDGGLFMVNSDGKGTVRLMSKFTANKSPGAGGKIAMKTDSLVGLYTVIPGVESKDDAFVISELGKIIRFQTAEVPAKEGVVQGVNCMALRGDTSAAMTVSRVIAAPVDEVEDLFSADDGDDDSAIAPVGVIEDSVDDDAETLDDLDFDAL